MAKGVIESDTAQSAMESTMDNEIFVPQSPESFSLDFERASIVPTDREIAVPLTPRYETFKKLEVFNAREINFMSKAYYIVSLIALIASVTVAVLARTTFAFPAEIPGIFPDLSLYIFPEYFALVDSILVFIVFGYAIVLLSVYSVILFREARSKVLHEQLWVIMLLITTVIYLIPYEAAVRLRAEFLKEAAPDTNSPISFVFVCMKIASFAVVSVLYIWFGTHSYRYLSRRVTLRDVWFYVPKIAAVAAYVSYKIWFLFAYEIKFAEMPFATFVAFLNLYASIGEWPKLGVIGVTVLTVLEIGLLGTVLYDISRTFNILRQAEYTQHRTKILGFRFFIHQHLVFNTIYSLTYIVLLLGIPNGIQIFQFVLHTIDEDGNKHPADGRGSYFDIQYSPFGLLLCVLAFVTIEAYTNLPANFSLGKFLLPCRHKDVEEDEEEREPIVYRNREPPSLTSQKDEQALDLRPSCFVMQTNVELFNLSWFVYYHGTEKEKSLKVDFEATNVNIRDYLYDKDTDTRVIVAETHDRIIYAFKGTSSTQNIVTDMNVRLLPFSTIVEDADIGNENGKRRLADLQSLRAFRKSKIHAGFASAYGTVKEGLRSLTRSLIQEKRRPIFLTGHSLGGALATLCSIDLCIAQNIPGNRIVVSTFGSPKVGNVAFQELYDSLITMHWRFVAGGDLISRIPKIGYRHVGKKVFLSSTGEMFIDPSALETVFWHSQSASIVHHRKSCYLLALKAWCDSLEGDYVPNFWPFPVSQNDSRKFDSTFRKPTSNRLTQRSFRGRDKATRDARLRGFAEAIDALDEEAAYTDDAIRLWRRLTERALSNDSL